MELDGQALTAAAVARLAGVGRAAVSNWRRRYPDFPQPTGGSPSSPTFSRAEVEAWLAATGKAGQLAPAGSTDTGTQRIGTPGPNGSLTEPATVDPPGSAVSELTGAQLLARVMVALLPRSTAADAAGGAEADLPVVVDPACAEATLLLAVADRFGDRVQLVGQEAEESAAAAAALSLRDHPHHLRYEIHVGDSLRDDRLGGYLGTAAAVVCVPPAGQPQWPVDELTTDPRWEFGIPAARDPELAWVQHCYAHLRSRGVAVVAVSARTCVQPSGRLIRSALVRSGALRDVIALPARLGPATGGGVHLWVLHRPHGPTDHAAVRMVDLSALGDPADAPAEFAGWQRLFADADPSICRDVPRLALLDGDTNLLPSRHVAARAEMTAADLDRVTGRLRDMYAHIGRGLPRFAGPPGSARPGTVTLGELERAGALTIRSRETTPRAGDLLLRTLGRPPAVATGTDADDAGVAQVVELDPARLDAHFVATFLRADAAALPVANTLGALSRDDLRRCRIPRLPLAAQRRYGDAFRWLQEWQAALSALAAISGNVIEQTIHGLTIGALAPETAAGSTDPTESETGQP
jgi:predicted DNA-binding transcriptional regulator AlpA